MAMAAIESALFEPRDGDYNRGDQYRNRAPHVRQDLQEGGPDVQALRLPTS